MSGHELVPVTMAGAFACGTILSLLGSIKLPLAQRLKIGEARIGLLLGAMNLALIPMLLLGGIFIDQYGVEWGMIAGSLLTAVAIALLALRETYAAAMATMWLFGAGAALVLTATNVLMRYAFFAGQTGAAVNLGYVYIAVGTLVIPVLAEAVWRKFGFKRLMGLLALLCLAPALVAALTPPPSYPVYREGDFGHVFHDPMIWVAGLVFLLYGPLEVAISTWATTFLTNQGHSERRAAWLLSGFWLAFLASRAVAVLLEQKLEHRSELWATRFEPILIVILGILAAAALGNLAGSSTRSGSGWGLVLVGFILGPIFPSLVAIIFRRFPNEPGTAFGAMYSSGALGSFLLAPAIGLYARQTTVQRALRIPMVVGVGLALAALVLALSL